MSEKLLPCPWCGCPAELTKSEKPNDDIVYSACCKAISCKAINYGVDCHIAPYSCEYFDSQEQAVAAWNRRAKPVIDDAMVEKVTAAYNGEYWGHMDDIERESEKALMRKALAVLRDGKGE